MAKKITKSIWPGWKLIELGKKPSGGHKLRIYTQRYKLLKQQLTTLNLIYPFEPSLVTGAKNQHITDHRRDFLINKIFHHFKGYSRLHQHKFFITGLARGVQKLDWQVTIPSPLHALANEPSPFTPERFAEAKAIKELQKLFLQSLESPPLFANKQEEKIFLAGQLIFSAAVHGGLLHKRWLIAMTDAIASKDIRTDNYEHMTNLCDSNTDQSRPHGLLWLNLFSLQKLKKDKERKYNRRWFPDPITTLLIIKWIKLYGHEWTTFPADFPENSAPYQHWQSTYRKKASSPGQHLQFILTSFLYYLGIPFANQPNFKEFISGCRAFTGLKSPQYLVRYASSLKQAVPLSPQAWARLRSDLKIKKYISLKEEGNSDQNTNQVGLSPAAEHKIAYQQPTTPRDQWRKMDQLRKCLSPARDDMVIKGIEYFLSKPEQLSPLLQLIARWCLERLRNARYDEKLRPSSLRTYYSTIFPELVAFGYDFDIAAPDPESWEALYDCVIMRVDDSEEQKTRKVRLLTSFHDFLRDTIGAPEIDLPDLAGISGRVNANIISHREYHRIKECLTNNNNIPERLREMQVLLLILGFRCGLRRNEALKLLLTDFQIERNLAIIPPISMPWPELLIRKNKYRNLSPFFP